jgi:hypothetical protein
MNKVQQKNPTHEIIRLIQFKHWIPLHHQKPSKSNKDFPFTIYIMDSHQKQTRKQGKNIFHMALHS